MSSGGYSGVTNGKQVSLEQFEAYNIACENEKNINEQIEYLRYELPKTSPIIIPFNSSIKSEHKPNGYDQVKYEWKSGNYKYISRWHTHTPGAPEYSQKTWVVERIRPGVGAGKNHRPKIHEVLVGNNKWIDWKIWNTAIKARKRGIETKEQRELLDNGHWNA